MPFQRGLFMNEFKMCQVDWRWLVSASAQILILCFLLESPLSNGLGLSKSEPQNYLLQPLIETGSLGHYCNGDVLVATSATIIIVDFTCDGARGTRFYLFKGAVPNKNRPPKASWEIPQVDGLRKSLKKYNKETIFLGPRFMDPLPDLREFDGLVVWNELDEVVFAYTMFPMPLNVPKFDPWDHNKPEWPLLTVDQVERSLQLRRGRIENLGQMIDEEANGHYCYTNGDIFAFTIQVLGLTGFNYDGTGPKAFFYLHRGPLPKNGKSLNPDNTVQIPDEYGTHGVLRKYKNELVLLNIPSVKLEDFDALIVWCDLAKVLFGYVLFPEDWELPPHERRILTEGKGK